MMKEYLIANKKSAAKVYRVHVLDEKTIDDFKTPYTNYKETMKEHDCEIKFVEKERMKNEGYSSEKGIVLFDEEIAFVADQDSGVQNKRFSGSILVREFVDERTVFDWHLKIRLVQKSSYKDIWLKKVDQNVIINLYINL